MYQAIMDREKQDEGFDQEMASGQGGGLEAWEAKKKAYREETLEHLDNASLRVNTDPQARDQYLNVKAHFIDYTASNALLVFEQKPHATRIADSDKWKKRGARIKKGERGFFINKPGREVERPDGSIHTYTDPVKVFDQSQTTARRRTMAPYVQDDVLRALIQNPVCDIQVAENLGGELSVYDHQNKCVHVQAGMDDSQLFWALATGMSHASMARGKQDYDPEANQSRAELSAEVLAKRYGFETGFGETPAPAALDAEPKEIRDSLSQVSNAAKNVNYHVQSVLVKEKERGKDMER